ncbi:MAG: PAS domain-containing protein [Acidobacteriia bacterium]|nr:PAS domain-containing protein [Terriglobia bacterium]
MLRNLNPLQITLLLGAGLVIVGLTAFILYVIHKAFQQQRKPEDFRPSSPKSGDESSILLASMQGVLSRMKARERELEALLREAEQRADSSTRTLEAVVRDLTVGLLIFTRDGFLALSNPVARELLGVDTWSRRRYPEILGAESSLSHHLRNALEAGACLHAETVGHRLPDGGMVLLEVTLTPFYGRSGQVEGAVCLLHKGGITTGLPKAE